jgi:DNA replication ATP-dependent helicase Dna2
MRTDSAKTSISVETDVTNPTLDNTTLFTPSESLNQILDGVEFTPDKSQQSLPTPEPVSRPMCYRRVVKSVSVRNVAEGSRSYKGQEELVLEVERVEGNEMKICLLRDDWTTTSVSTGDNVHIVGYFSPTADILVLDNSTNAFIIIHPDILVQGTSVTQATNCTRRSLLDGIFKKGNVSELTLVGQMVHHVFDEAMKKCDFSTSWLTAVTNLEARRLENLNMMFSLGISEDLILGKIRELLPALQEWAEMYVHPVDEKNKKLEGDKSGCRAPIAVTQLHDIEENIWSPQFGLKGKIDATVGVKIHRRPSTDSSFKSFQSLGDLLVPLELKTGKMMSPLGSVEHRAQVILYSLMLSDRHDIDVPSGLLLYLKTGHMTGVPSPLNEQRALIMKRNEVACYLATHRLSSSQTFEFPPVLGVNHKFFCLRCPQRSNCMLYHRAVEGGSDFSSGIGDKFNELVGHFSEEELAYFRSWFKMVSLESRAQQRKFHQHKLWTTPPELRQVQGSCLSGMQLLSVESNDSKSDRFIHKFTSTAESSHASLLAHQDINKGDLVVISRERKETNHVDLAVGTGFIVNFDHQQCTVNLDKELSMHSNFVYHIDKHESLSVFSTSISNLVDLFVSNNSDVSHRLRQLIVNLQPPQFVTPKCERLCEALECVKALRASQLQTGSVQCPVTDILATLNSDQLFAVEKVLSASHYALILGMPGTGKTMTIACIVQVLVECGKRVLLTSYTHSAVDNVLIKLQKAGIDCLRASNPDRVHVALQSKTVSELASEVTTVAELRDIYVSKPVVGTTCLGINQPCFRQLHFDYCIVDEASQVTQPVCLGPLFYADVFVLVGDHNQLPPLIQSSQARDSGMDVSLFKRLSEQNPSALVFLEHQYRMNKDIMLLSNAVIYNSQLKCATQVVANEVMHLPKWNQWRQLIENEHSHLTWMVKAVNPMNTVLFLDTDMLDSDEMTKFHGSVSNDVEAKLVLWLILELLEVCVV